MTGRIECEWDRLLTDESGAVTLSFRALDKEAAKRLAAEIRGIQGEKREKPVTFDVSVDKHREKRSKDANAYMWELIGRIAEVIGATPRDVYRRQIIDSNGRYDPLLVYPESFGRLKEAWESKGIGWIAERMDTADNGMVIVNCYYGSSTYTSGEMSRLIDSVIAECRELGIETMPPAELERLLSSYGGGKRNDKV